MATPVFYQTLSNMGVDPTIYYTQSFSAGGSVSPENPAPPFSAGTRAFGNDGSEFVFVQASTSIGLTDFLAINVGQAVAPYQANSLTTTNIQSSLLAGIGSAGLVLRQSVTYIPAAAFFWALVRGQYIPATTSVGLSGNTPAVQLYTSATAGLITSVTTSASLAVGLAGIVCVNSLTTGISASVVPTAGALLSGLTQGPVVNLNLPRTVNVFCSVNTAGSSIYVGY